MAEYRRVGLQSIPVSKDEKKETKRTLVLRFSLSLAESTARTCSEFSFVELVKKEKESSVSESNADDPFGDDDECHDELAALARKYEEKYGPKSGYAKAKPSKGKKRKLKCLEDDYGDLGDGYDETDPFIDNTEAYDEVVPSDLTTKHGGFYINRGTLEFRNQSDQDDSEEEFTTPVARKRGRPRKIMDSDEENEEDFKKKKFKKKKVKEGIELEQKKKKKKITFGPDGEKIIKRKKLMEPDKQKKMSPTEKEQPKVPTPINNTPSVVNGNSNQHPPSPSPSPRPNLSPPEDKGLEGGGDWEEKKGGEVDVQLPPDLPAHLEAAIVDIKKAAKDSTEGKCKFFTNHVNKLLLDIELSARRLAPGKRPIIYAHLACHLPCGKETLVKRAKKLRENQEDDKLKMPLVKLKEEIDKVMPFLQAEHDKEVAKFRLEKREGAEPQKEEGVNTESDEEDKSASQGTVTDKSRKGNRDPRKKFKWNAEIKALLNEIVAVKMELFDTYKFRNQTAEDYIKAFLEIEVKTLWPQGWIQTRMLFKETRSVHGNWTNPNKVKRPGVTSRSTASPTPTTNTTDNQPSPPPHPLTTTAPNVIELSDAEEPVSNKDKARPLPSSQPEDFSRNQTSDRLKFSPNSKEAMASATAAAAAALASPKTEAPPSSLGERRPHLMSEILKRPGSSETGSGVHRPVPKTPPASDAAVSPFMAEFSRYLTTSNSMGSVPSSYQEHSNTNPPVSQVQSKTVSSSTGVTNDRKMSSVMRTTEGDSGVDKSKQRDSLSSSHQTSVHGSQQGAALETSNQAHYKMMAAALKGGDHSDSHVNKSKGEVVRDQILAKIQAEIDANTLELFGDMGGKKPAVSRTSVSNPSPNQLSPSPSQLLKQTPSQPFAPFTTSKTGPGGAVARQPFPLSAPKQTSASPLSAPKQASATNTSVSKQSPPSSLPPRLPAPSMTRPSFPGPRPNLPGSRPPAVPRQSTNVSRQSSSPVPRQSLTNVSRQSPTPVSRQSPISVPRQQSPSNVTQVSSNLSRQSPTTVTQQMSQNINRQTPSNMTRQPSPSNMTRQMTPANVTRQPTPSNVMRQPTSSNVTRQPSQSNITRQMSPSNVTRQPSPSSVTQQPSPSSVTRQPSPSSVTRQMSPNISRQSPGNLIRQPQNNTPRQSQVSVAGPTSVMPSRQMSAAPNRPTTMTPRSAVTGQNNTRGGTSKPALPPFSSQQPVQAHRAPTSLPISVSEQKRPSTNFSRSPVSGAPPSQHSSPAMRVSTPQGSQVLGQGQMNAQLRMTTGTSLLQRSSPMGLTSGQKVATSETGHKVLGGMAGGTSLSSSRGQGVNPALGSSQGQVRPTAIAMDTQNRQSPGLRPSGDKAATVLMGSQGSKPVNQPAAHSRPSVHPGSPRLQHPTAAAVTAGKGTVKPVSTHSGLPTAPSSSPSPSSPAQLPQAVDPPKPPPRFSQ